MRLVYCLSWQSRKTKPTQERLQTVLLEVSATQKNAAKECKELDKQLTTLFGADYSLTDPKVIAQLQKNIDDKNASPAIRKYSLFVAYGSEYTQHVNRIQTNK
ncbi:MAG: hypothetical protein IPH46_09260 [Bacteroidetes bacterium]|nr:hypothetical protein [Bacteroidota bacterium]